MLLVCRAHSAKRLSPFLSAWLLEPLRWLTGGTVLHSEEQKEQTLGSCRSTPSHLLTHSLVFRNGGGG